MTKEVKLLNQEIQENLSQENEVVSFESAIMEIVKRKDIDPERLEKFLEMQVSMEDRQNKKSYKTAMANFQGECPIIKQNKHVCFGKVDYRYAPLDEIIHIIKPIMSKHGLSYSFDTRKGEQDNRVLITEISHKDGHSEEFTHFFQAMHDDGRMNESQRSKSAITFAKRAALENALGIVTAGEDDDARRLSENMITENQKEEIKTLMANTNTEEPALFKHLNISSLEDLTELDAKKAVKSLEQKRRILVDRKGDLK